MVNAIDGISRQEFDQAHTWLMESSPTVPPHIRQIIGKLLHGYNLFAHNKSNNRETLIQLRMAMGFIPKTEKGSSENKSCGYR